MPIIGKKVWGIKNSFEATEKVAAILTKAGFKMNRGDSNYESRTYDRNTIIRGTPIKFSYNSSLPGFGTIRWPSSKGTGHSIIVEALRQVAWELDRNSTKPIITARLEKSLTR